jgi:hypothetical protein
MLTTSVSQILFLDVLFPLELERVIFVDSDQIVRTDLKELIDMDIEGAPYAYAPMGDDPARPEMEGFRFWKTGCAVFPLCAAPEAKLILPTLSQVLEESPSRSTLPHFGALPRRLEEVPRDRCGRSVRTLSSAPYLERRVPASPFALPTVLSLFPSHCSSFPPRILTLLLPYLPHFDCADFASSTRASLPTQQTSQTLIRTYRTMSRRASPSLPSTSPGCGAKPGAQRTT